MASPSPDCIVPPGRWGVGVSGGADSVALLRLVADRPAVVLHFDHVTREGDSALDAEFVVELCRSLGVDCVVGRRSDEDCNENNWPARLRAARFRFFADQIRSLRLEGVLLAHHADDQAETVALQLLRGGRPIGMRADTTVDGLRVVRPLLDWPAESLRSIAQSWREDESNRCDAYARNRLRPFLRARPTLSAALVNLATATQRLVDAERAAAPVFDGGPLDVPPPLARAAVGRWLATQGIDVDRRAVDAVIAMATDRAIAGRRQLPGGRFLTRRGGQLVIEPLAPASS